MRYMIPEDVAAGDRKADRGVRQVHGRAPGNQPRMKAEKQTDRARLVFRCAGGTNMKSENDEHMHRATIVWKDDDRIHSEWEEVKDGKNVMTASFNLARRM